ncbi:MAG: aldose 1-epimerase [Gammaproteobacteria bacterium]|nr:aldose 1-epimerase [Gammaproteobacteria bacterium]MDH5304467.1 aldose 1-epimerase [Gammaproteobacteria bacterium]MDH5321705.1 aldose 1-epimerase [Gammaproteobacteria bacterium]
MRSLRIELISCAVLLLPGISVAAEARYSAVTSGDIVQLHDPHTNTTVSVLTPVSNAYEFVVKGHNVLRMRINSVDEMRARPALNGIPLLAPFANRLDETAFYANGNKYNFDLELGNIRSPIPIHGYVTGANAWKVIETGSDASGAWVTSQLDFYRIPAYMQQFPFAHTLTMTYKLADGALEVRTRVDNLSAAPMPLAIGYHPYFQLTDSVRNDWTLNVPASTHWILSETKIPTGATDAAEKFWGRDPRAVALKDFATRDIDDVFSDLERDAQGRATFTVRGKKQSLAVTVGPKYKTMLVYSTAPRPPGSPPQGGNPQAEPPPPVSVGPDIPLSATDSGPVPDDRGFVAFEPMVGITNSMNLAHKGLYDELQSIPPGEYWEESFWVRPDGF